jgi:hypothetical protein
MEEMIGGEFNVTNFPRALNFFRSNYNGLTQAMIYDLNSRLNYDMMWADNILRLYMNRDL